MSIIVSSLKNSTLVFPEISIIGQRVFTFGNFTVILHISNFTDMVPVTNIMFRSLFRSTVDMVPFKFQFCGLNKTVKTVYNVIRESSQGYTIQMSRVSVGSYLKQSIAGHESATYRSYRTVKTVYKNYSGKFSGAILHK